MPLYPDLNTDAELRWLETVDRPANLPDVIRTGTVRSILEMLKRTGETMDMSYLYIPATGERIEGPMLWQFTAEV